MGKSNLTLKNFRNQLSLLCFRLFAFRDCMISVLYEALNLSMAGEGVLC